MPPLDRPFPLAIGVNHPFGDRRKGHDLDPRRFDDAARLLRTVQQHAERADEGDLAVGVIQNGEEVSVFVPFRISVVPSSACSGAFPMDIGRK
jgi:hypothetical protein